MTEEPTGATEVTNGDMWMATMGRIPPTMTALRDALPEVEASYSAIRSWLYEQRPDGLDTKTKELIFVVIDIIAGQYEGACTHAKASARAGLSSTQLREALAQCFMVRGINSWGLGGMKVWNEVGAPLAAEETAGA